MVRQVYRLVFTFFLLAAASAPVWADVFGTVKGVVHDPQHRPVPAADVTLKALRADWSRTTKTDGRGEFQLTAVPVGEYSLSVTVPGFVSTPQTVTVASGAVSEVHVPLSLDAMTQSVSVSAVPDDVRPGSATPTTLISRDDIATTPGADRTNSLGIITAYVPGSFLTHDQLHLRGGHQVTWLIDGVPVPNTNIATNVGPQIDPKDIDYLEAERGGYGAATGDRTYGVFNIVPRNGFERSREAELVASAGTFRQTNDQFSFGSHTDRFAYYASVTGNRSDLGLETPTASVLHDRQSGLGGFSSLIFNLNAVNQLRVVAAVRADDYQIPNSPDDQVLGLAAVQHEADRLLNVSWVRTFGHGTLLTVSPFYHFNATRYDGGPLDFPVSTTDERSSQYGGAQITVTHESGRNGVEAGFYGFHQADIQTFGLTFNDGSRPDFSHREQPSGTVAAVFVEDRLKLAAGLTVTIGVRQTHFAGALTEDATSPRIGASFVVPSLGWIVRGFYGRYYQSPPLLTASGPLLEFVNGENLGFIPLRGERDKEYQVGVTIPIHGWVVDSDLFRTRATNFFDHSSVGNSNVFFPLTIEGATLQGWTFTLRSPRAWKTVQFHLAYALQQAQGHGGISGGLTDFAPAEGDTFPLDHDQRHTLGAGFEATLPHAVMISGTAAYGSGFINGDGPDRLSGHMTVDVAVAKSFANQVTLSVSALNLANRHLLIDNSETFGGVHFNSPREVLVELRFRFHY